MLSASSVRCASDSGTRLHDGSVGANVLPSGRVGASHYPVVGTSSKPFSVKDDAPHRSHSSVPTTAGGCVAKWRP